MVPRHIRKRFFNSADAFSQLLNCMFLPNAEDTNAHESISARSYRAGWSRPERVINLIFFWEPDHCQGAYDRDVRKAEKLIEIDAQRPQ
ncbi:hypothetical protein XM53_00910 [Roseovarius atlanticus]|uniref:Uncharacterized protein n=1 Tax=Roseovarius atlanticus TaxID=1641875 RepID=A0A0T5NZN1_9RHOB|nr:hypothetical protein XM53_00910 [Roseovarius atlanticus]